MIKTPISGHRKLTKGASGESGKSLGLPVSGDSHPAHLQVVSDAGQGGQQLWHRKRVSLTEEARGAETHAFPTKSNETGWEWTGKANNCVVPGTKSRWDEEKNKY